jgi:hypothetical protein
VTRHTGHGWRPLVVLAGAQACGQSGTWAALAAALPSALARPDPAVWLSVLTAAWAAPAALVRLCGTPIDRRGPRVMGAASWGFAALAAALPLIAHLGMPVLVAVLAVMSLAGGCGVAAGDTAPSWLPGRPDLARAGAWLTAAADLSVGAGALGASSLTAIGQRPAWGLVVALSASAAVLSATVPAVPPQHRPAELEDSPQLATGRGRIGIPGVLAATAGIWIGYGVITILEALYVRRVLHAPMPVYGWLLAVWAVAGTLSSAAAHRWPRVITGPRAVPVAAAITAAGEALFIGTGSLAVSVAGSAVFGVGAALFGLACRAVLITGPPDRHGRILTTWRAIQAGCDIAPALVTGALVGALGLASVLDLAPALGAFTAVAVLAGGRRPPARTALHRSIAPRPYHPIRAVSNGRAAS